MKRLIPLLSLVLALIVLTMACGDSEAKDKIVLKIGTPDDELKYTHDKLTAKAGTEAVLTYRNSSTVNQHNWVLVLNGTKDAIAAEGAKAGPNNDWTPPDDDRIIAQTKLIEPGETGEVRFTVPPAGTYQFICTFPGHHTTMLGTFEVVP